MGRHVRLGALLGALAMSFSLATAWAEEPAWIQLQGGLKARLLNALEVKPVDGREAEVLVNFMLSDPSVIADHAKIIDVADQLFGRVVMTPVDERGFKLAGVLFLAGETRQGDTTVQTFEDFHYARRDDGVWLRQAGAESWKTAQDPNAWTPPVPEQVKLSGGATVFVDFMGEIFPPPGATRAFGIEMRSATPLLDVQTKYSEMKALWGRFRRDKLKAEGFDYVRMENYTDAQRGRFQVRKMVYLNIPRKPNEDWPTLPDQMPQAPVVAGLDSNLADEAAKLAAAAIAAVVPAQPVARVAARSDSIAMGSGVGREAVDAKARTAPGDYITRE